MKTKFYHRLSFYQARNAVLIGLLLALIVSGIQITFDLIMERQQLDETILQISEMVKGSAAQAAYDLDELQTTRAVNGLFHYQSIHKAKIVDDFGAVLAKKERPLIQGRLNWLVKLTFGREKEYSIPLVSGDLKEPVGSLIISVDNYLNAKNFIKRSGMLILGDIMKNLVLACVLTIMLYYTLTLPLFNMGKDLTAVDIDHPAKAQITIPLGHEKNEMGLLGKRINRLLKKIEENLSHIKLAEKSLAAKNKDLEDIVYASCHDFRSPLVNILGFKDELISSCDELNQILLSEGKKTDKLNSLFNEMNNALYYIVTNTSKMDHLITGLTILTRMSQKAPMVRPINMDEMIENILKRYGTAVTHGKTATTLGKLPTCQADREHVDLIFTHLIKNALAYLDPNRKGNIKIEGKIKNKQAIYVIEDNGIGISPKYHKKIFELFHRLDTNKPVSGDGMGLAIVLRMLAKNEGKIWIESEEGKGSRFYVSLPHEFEI
ncbi:ATP-binding protein [Candidatus Auribacterota bacterium]